MAFVDHQDPFIRELNNVTREIKAIPSDGDHHATVLKIAINRFVNATTHFKKTFPSMSAVAKMLNGNIASILWQLKNDKGLEALGESLSELFVVNELQLSKDNLLDYIAINNDPNNTSLATMQIHKVIIDFLDLISSDAGKDIRHAILEIVPTKKLKDKIWKKGTQQTIDNLRESLNNPIYKLIQNCDRTEGSPYIKPDDEDLEQILHYILRLGVEIEQNPKGPQTPSLITLYEKIMADADLKNQLISYFETQPELVERSCMIVCENPDMPEDIIRDSTYECSIATLFSSLRCIRITSLLKDKNSDINNLNASWPERLNKLPGNHNTLNFSARSLIQLFDIDPSRIIPDSLIHETAIEKVFLGVAACAGAGSSASPFSTASSQTMHSDDSPLQERHPDDAQHPSGPIITTALPATPNPWLLAAFNQEDSDDDSDSEDKGPQYFTPTVRQRRTPAPALPPARLPSPEPALHQPEQDLHTALRDDTRTRAPQAPAVVSAEATADTTVIALEAFKGDYFSQKALEVRAAQVKGCGSKIKLPPKQESLKVSSSDKAIWDLLVTAIASAKSDTNNTNVVNCFNGIGTIIASKLRPTGFFACFKNAFSCCFRKQASVRRLQAMETAVNAAAPAA